MKQVDWNYCYYHRHINPHTFKCTWLKKIESSFFYFHYFSKQWVIISSSYDILKKQKVKKKKQFGIYFALFVGSKKGFPFGLILLLLLMPFMFDFTLFSLFRSLSLLLRGLLHVINIDNCLIYASRIDKNQILWTRWCQKARNKHLLCPKFDLRS